MNKEILLKLVNQRKLSIFLSINKNPQSINQITLKSKQDYKNVYRYLIEFERKKLIKINRKGQGKPSMVTLK